MEDGGDREREGEMTPPTNRHWKNVEENRAVLLQYFRELTERYNPLYRKSKHIVQELNGQAPSPKSIGAIIGDCIEKNIFTENGFKVEKWGCSKSTTWRVERI